MAAPEFLASEFSRAADQAGLEGWPCRIRHEALPAPHSKPQLPPGDAVVYVFAFSEDAGHAAPCGPGTVLKVGKATRNERFRYMHYKPGSSRSNLAKSLLAYPILWPWLGIQQLTTDSVDEWIRTHLDRTHFFDPAGNPQVLATLEVYIRARVGSVFEGA